MGKWSTYRKRGGSRPAPALPPPPAPTLYEDQTRVIQESVAPTNVGGLLELWTFETGVGPWTLWSEVPWVDVKDWGSAAYFSGYILRGREIGNEIAWQGEGYWSEELGLE